MRRRGGKGWWGGGGGGGGGEGGELDGVIVVVAVDEVDGGVGGVGEGDLELAGEKGLGGELGTEALGVDEGVVKLLAAVVVVGAGVVDGAG